jgi:hypothetical protein
VPIAVNMHVDRHVHFVEAATIETTTGRAKHWPLFRRIILYGDGFANSGGGVRFFGVSPANVGNVGLGRV